MGLAKKHIDVLVQYKDEMHTVMTAMISKRSIVVSRDDALQW